MKLEVSARDRIFAAVAVPVCVLAAYFFLVRAPAAGRIGSLRQTLARTGSPAQLRLEGDALARRRVAAAEALEEARRAGEEPAGPDWRNRAAPVPRRVREVSALFSDSGAIRLVSAEPLGRGAAAAGAPAAAAIAAAAGIDAPETWRFRICAGFPAVLSALAALDESRLPAVVEALALPSARGVPGEWVLDICL